MNEGIPLAGQPRCSATARSRHRDYVAAGLRKSPKYAPDRTIGSRARSCDLIQAARSCRSVGEAKRRHRALEVGDFTARKAESLAASGMKSSVAPEQMLAPPQQRRPTSVKVIARNQAADGVVQDLGQPTAGARVVDPLSGGR